MRRQPRVAAPGKTAQVCVMSVPRYNIFMDSTSSAFRVEKTAFSVASLFDESDEKAFWLSKTPYERLQAVELMRQVIYGYEPASARLQRLFEVAELQTS
jgi:hypothetical protein